MLISSLVTLGFLLAAAARENVTAEWRHVQKDYQRILLAKAGDATSRRVAGQFPVEIRQVTVPALNTVDRCVSCHLGIDDPRMKDQPEPHRAHPKELLKIHRTEKFGCTVCHQGQGAALTFHEAKAEDYFWDYPLLPASLTEASCNSCHDPRALPRGAAAKLVRGMELFDEKGCWACHKLDGKGGQLGPALDNVGLKTKHQFIRANLKGSQTVWHWLSQHFRDPMGIVPGSRMPAPALTPVENEALTVYMLSLRKRSLPEEYLAPDKIEQKYARLHPPAPNGEALYKQYCASCHDTGLYTRWDKNFQRFVPAIRNPSFVRTEDDECLLANVEEGRPGTFMPAWGPKAGGLSKPEMEALVAYLRGAVKPAELAAAPAGGSVERGRTLFGRNCAGCHGAQGQGLIAPALANPVFQKAATDAFIAETIRSGRENTPMPAFARAGFGQAEIADLIAHIRKGFTK
ncbi:MAG: c-type cytochrome [Acidobacteria bacterium]|nr:c-type cytochrome [Acidobacteriota bacterium]